jgi:hypothetical protein
MDLPSEDALRWIVSTYAGLRARHGEAIGDPVLVQPTAEFFPDEFRLDGPSVERMLRRMIHYAPVSDGLGIALAFVEPDEDHAGGCGSGACTPATPRASGRADVEELDDGYRVSIATADVPRAEVLAGSLSRAIGALVLHEAGERVEPRASEIAAVAAGFGVLLANGAAVWAKACGGLRMARATALSVEEVGVALALFGAVHGRKASEARAQLGPTQRAAFDAALEWVDSNRAIVEALRDRPVMLESGAFDIEPLRGTIGRWLHKRKQDRELRALPAAQAPTMTEERRRHLEEARALVDEVMGR